MRRLTFFVMTILLAGNVCSLELTSGVLQEFGMKFTEEQRSALTVVTSEVREVASREETGISLAFLRLGETDDWFRLYRNMTIYGVDVSQPKLLGSWAVTRWTGDTYLPDEIVARYKINGVEPGSEFYPSAMSIYAAKQSDRLFGCLTDTPLRYGDFTGDGSAEVVLIGDDIAVFSPQTDQVIFTQRIRLNDWLPASEQESLYSFIFNDNPPEELAQYVSQLAITYWGQGNPQPAWMPAYRGYSKLFQGSFSGAESHDLLVWHKFYRSLQSDNQMKGFERISQTLIHYRLVDGGYQQEQTSEATIRSWLSANDLTWQKGYPSHSECPGAEGELIPEMHDPLLNDADVLQ